jgi:hypothetical protein
VASLQVRLSDLITAIGTDIKQLRTWITGSSSGDLTGLATTDKTSIVNALNEVRAGAVAPSAASETVSGIAELATQTETNTGTDDARIVTPLKLQTRMAAYAQPLDSDLTAIAALSTTSYGRALLALAVQTAFLALHPTVAETVASIIELATQTEVNTGTDDVRAVTPLKFQTRLAAYALPASYLDTDVTLAANSDVKVPSQKAAKAYIDGIIAAANAAVYKGVIDASANPNYPAADAGWMYRISVAGKIGGASGTNVEVGDMILCLTDGTSVGTQAAVGANWDIIQANIDGAVVGPSSSTAADIATFSGTTGKIVQDSGVQVSTDGTLATNNNTKVPTEGAIRTYLAATYYTQTQLGNPDTDLAALYTTAKT